MGLIAPYIVLLVLSRGMTLTEAGVISAIFAGVSVIGDVPAGLIADVFGARATVLVGAAATALGLACYALAGSVTLFIIGALLMGLGRACDSGTLQAWLANTPTATSEEVGYAMTRGYTVQAGSMALGSFIGALLTYFEARGHTGHALATPVWAAFALAAVYAGLLATQPTVGQRDPPSDDDGAAASITVLLSGVTRDPDLVVLLIADLGASLGAAAVELLWQPRIASTFHRLPSAYLALGLTAAVGLGLGMLGTLMTERADAKFIRVVRRCLYARVAGALMIAALGLAADFSLALAAVCVYIFTTGVSGPTERRLLNTLSSQAIRTSVFSLSSVFGWMGWLFSALALAPIAQATSLRTAFLIAAALLLTTTCLLLALLVSTRVRRTLWDTKI